MKIAVIHSFYTGNQASGENALVDNQIIMLRSKGHSVNLYSKVTELESTDKFYALKCLYRILTRRGANFSSEIACFKPDLILVHNLFPNISSYWLRRIKIKKIFFLHNLRPWCSNGFMLRKSMPCNKCTKNSIWGTVHKCANNKLLRSLIQSLNQMLPSDLYLQQKNGAVIATVSEQSKAQVVKLEPRLKIESIPNFTYTFQERFPKFASLDFDSNTQSKFVWVGRISHEKGLHKLLEIWPNKYCLDVIGNGPDFEKLKKSYSSNKNIEFLGYLSNLDVMRTLKGYRAMVNSSLWAEFGPLTVIEALACGLPVILTKSLPISIAVIQSKAGLNYDITSKKTLTQCLDTMMDKELRENFSKSAVALHAESFSFEQWHKRIMQIPFPNLQF